MAEILANYKIDTPQAMQELGAKLARELKAGDLVVLTGPLGAGKTTLTRGIGQALGAIGTVSSPTFVIARTHRRDDGGPNLVHVDAYRLSSVAELDDLDIDFENSITIVEWGKDFVHGLVQNWIEIEIERTSSNQNFESDEPDERLVKVIKHEAGKK